MFVMGCYNIVAGGAVMGTKFYIIAATVILAYACYVYVTEFRHKGSKK